MDIFNPDSYCGIYCGACSIAVYGQTGSADSFVTCLRNLPKKELVCSGCRSNTVYAGCSICVVRSCARGRNVEHCIECPDYPCNNIRICQRAGKILPHTRETAFSLEAIKRDSVDCWLDAQKKRWSCPDCGTPFSWYASTCSKCGRSLALRAYKLSSLKRLLCRFALTSAYRKAKAKDKSA